MSQVGWTGDPAISEAIYPVIHKFSLGIPRRINMICSRLLLHGCVEELHKIGIKDAKAVLNEIKQEQLTSEEIPADSDFDVEDSYEQPQGASVEDIQQAKKKVLNTPVAAPLHIAANDHEHKAHEEAEPPQPEKAYKGPRSRRRQRRTGEDRRHEVRFEARSAERRQNPGRRKEDSVSSILSRRLWGKGN